MSPKPAPSMEIVHEVASMEDADPSELQPLAEVIESDAIDALFEAATRLDASPTLTFWYEDHFVTVTGDGTVDVDAVE